MNIKKVEKSVKKINQLLENIKEENSVSAIERDLLLSYIRDLYDKVLLTDEAPTKTKKQAPQQTRIYSEPEKIVEAPYSPPPMEIADVVRQEIRETATHIPEPQMETLKPQQPITQSVIVEPVVDNTPQVPEAPQELLELFEAGSGNELSDRLGRSPILDLTKSMGINERIFTVNELFGGDTSLFNTTMSNLDKLTSLEQARDYLVTNVAIDQNWASEGKIKKVANFVKLISRRY